MKVEEIIMKENTKNIDNERTLKNVGGGEEDFSFTVYLVWGHSCFSL
jgi:hypothetical protein